MGAGAVHVPDPACSQVDSAAQDLTLFQLSPLCSGPTSPSVAALPGDASPGCVLSLGTMGRKCSRREGSWAVVKSVQLGRDGGEMVQRSAEQARE